jgi:DNA-binding transcriptional regulator LsrR (DeoR family)
MVKTPEQPTEFTTSQVAEKLGIVSRSVRGLIERGRFPNARKLPGSTNTYLIPLSDLEAELARREARKQKRHQSAKRKPVT